MSSVRHAPETGEGTDTSTLADKMDRLAKQSAVLAAVQSGDVVLASYRTIFKKEYERDWRGTDEMLVDLIADTDDDMDEGAWAKAMREIEKAVEETDGNDDGGDAIEAETPTGDAPITTTPTAPATEEKAEPLPTKEEMTAQVRIADAVHSFAIDTAKKIGADMAKEQEAQWEAKRKTATAAMAILLFMRRDLDKDAMQSLPVPGTPAVTEDGKKVNNPDAYTRWVKVKGEFKKQNGAFWDDFPDATTFGQKIVDQIQKIDDVLADRPNADPRYIKMQATPGLLKSERATLVSARAYNRTLFKRAYALYQKLDAVNAMKNCGARILFLKDKDGKDTNELRKTTQPIVVYNKHEPTEAAPCTLGRFLGFDIAKAEKDGGTLGDLLASGTGDGDAETPTGDTDTDMDVRTFDTGMAAFAHWLDDDANISQVYKRLNTKKPEDSDDLLCSIFDVFGALKAITDKAEYRNRYQRVQLQEGADKRKDGTTATKIAGIAA